MGLEDFTSDDNSVSSTDRETNTENEVSRPSTDNSPTDTHNVFGGLDIVSSNRIKWQIESLNYDWIKQFSHKRSDSGELVMYTSGLNNIHTGTVVAVFTTIKPFDTDPPYDEVLPLRITTWDLDKNEAVGEPRDIHHSGEWKYDIIKPIDEACSNLPE